MELTIRHDGGFDYIREGNGPNLLLLHGLFGALSNWNDMLDAFSDRYTVLIPLLPIYTPTRRDATLDGLVQFVHEFVEHMKLSDMTVVGNSLGGHLAMMYSLAHPDKVKSLLLTGSSGLFEAGMGVGFVRRGDRGFIRERIEFTFWNPKTASDDLVNEVFDIVNNRLAAMRILNIAREAQRMNMAHQMPKLKMKTCLIWGLNDNITPPYVAHEFRKLIPNAELHFIDHCGHAAMMEQPSVFNVIAREFLDRQHGLTN